MTAGRWTVQFSIRIHTFEARPHFGVLVNEYMDAPEAFWVIPSQALQVRERSGTGGQVTDVGPRGDRPAGRHNHH